MNQEENLMRSYQYTNGSVQPCPDALPAPISGNSRGQRSSAFSLYEAAMKKRGFIISQGSEYLSRLGSLTVYARDHATLSEQRTTQEAFDFCCVLSLGGSSIRIWITDLPTLLLFFKEIDVQGEKPTGPSDQWVLWENATRVLGELLTGDLTLNVRTS